MSSVIALPLSDGRFAQFRHRHLGETIVVCGCGESLTQLRFSGRFVTIGVNDVGRLFTPDYLVVVNERRQFTAERYSHIEGSQARAVFSQLELAHPHAVHFRLGRRGGTDVGAGDSLHYTSNSPYVAVNLARYMGASRIGLIGVDFSDGHFFGATGQHPLATQLTQIDREYAALLSACRADGVELVNLSGSSRLTSLPKIARDPWLGAAATPPPDDSRATRRVFFVHYRFLSCGTVFETGLCEAARTLGIEATHAYWNDAQLPSKIEAFRPDLLFVVHGRSFAQRWGERFKRIRSAVWLVDEPYEVDDTSGWSNRFDHVFLSDSATLSRHRNSHELQVAYAPVLHRVPPGGTRRHRVGFIGGGNPSRERILSSLAHRGLLSYVIGGPWRDPKVNALCLFGNVPAEKTAELYQQTTIVVNVFRDQHHFNRASIAARSMNPRICEALACGALVISEPREDLQRLVPELPTFRNESEAAALVERFLADPADCARVQSACAARLADATYTQRLRTVMDTVFQAQSSQATPPIPTIAHEIPLEGSGLVPFDDEWDDLGSVVRRASDGSIVFEPGERRGPGVERGLTSRARFSAVDLTFEASLGSGACLLAKIQQVDRIDQLTNSYHLHVDERTAYLARHQNVFRRFESPRNGWTRFRISHAAGVLSIWRNDRLLHRVRDSVLAKGFAFIGAQGGSVRVRGLRLSTPEQSRVQTLARDQVDEVISTRVPPPRVSIITTVYDRTECLRRCVDSVRAQALGDYEHLIVADHPPAGVFEEIHSIAAEPDDPRLGLFNLRRRFNNWGIAPAAAGMRRARGEYLAFLSDDNGYTRDHFDPLMRVLDSEPSVGFVYSSCQYDGRLVLNHPVPRPGRIDLGQPLFRRELFADHLNGDLPFDMMAWDWHLVDTLMRRGVRWRHIDRPSFIFRLAKYPQLMARR